MKDPKSKWSKKGKIVYMGIRLDSSSEKKLQDWWKREIGPLHGDVKSHHMTIVFKPTAEQYENAFKVLGNSKVSLKVNGYVNASHIQAVSVEDGGLSENLIPHVTVAVGEGGSAKDSNDALKARTDISGPTLTGTLMLFGRGKEVVGDIPWETQ